jgi:hypothetical protein
MYLVVSLRPRNSTRPQFPHKKSTGPKPTVVNTIRQARHWNAQLSADTHYSFLSVSYLVASQTRPNSATAARQCAISQTSYSIAKTGTHQRGLHTDSRSDHFDPTDHGLVDPFRRTRSARSRRLNRVNQQSRRLYRRHHRRNPQSRQRRSRLSP